MAIISRVFSYGSRNGLAFHGAGFSCQWDDHNCCAIYGTNTHVVGTSNLWTKQFPLISQSNCRQLSDFRPIPIFTSPHLCIHSLFSLGWDSLTLVGRKYNAGYRCHCRRNSAHCDGRTSFVETLFGIRNICGTNKTAYSIYILMGNIYTFQIVKLAIYGLYCINNFNL